MKRLLPIVLIAFVINAGFLCSKPLGKTIAETGSRETIAVLASDEFEGRGTGTEGERKAAAWIAGKFDGMGLTPKGDSSWYQTYKNIPKSPMQIHHGDTSSIGMGLVKEITTRNVIGYLDNKAASTVIIGAHYDHLGYGDENSLWTGEKAIHNGADDNASGVAGLLELAKWLALKPLNTTGHNYLFIAFSGEEKGLWGSNYFTKHPTIDLKTAAYMLNMDMIGRMNSDRALAINGVGTSPEWMKVIPNIKVDNLKIVTSESGTGPSDHTSFYNSNIPALHFFTGQHEDYHKPSDDAAKINYEGLASVVNFIKHLIVVLDSKGQLTFTKTKEEEKASASDFKVTLGVMPDYLYNERGLRVDGVKEDRPGHKAGLIKGDIIIQLGNYNITDIYAYMEALGKFEKGQTTDCKILRNGEEMTLKVVW
jgi:hypothetical protein